MRVEVVAAPMRYRRTPLVLLLLIAVLPAVGMLVGYRWLAGEADRYDQGGGAGAAAGAVPDAQ